jgi:predicted DCC family thiol-disulfide oxidoreductase YuxK
MKMWAMDRETQSRVEPGEPEAWVLYDGACGFCSRWVPFWAPTLRGIGVSTAALQEKWVGARLSLPPEDLLSDITLLFRDGRMLRGAEAYRYAMRRIWWAYPLYLLSIAPGLRSLFDAGYRIFARNRYRVSSACRFDPPSNKAGGA